MQVPVYNMQGAQVATLNVDEKSLGGEVNAPLLKQAFVMYHANLRQGSSKTKNRHEVEGSTKKIYKQKGTGNARHGDRKVNIFKGGGHGHSKKMTREDFRKDMPKKMRRKANRNALLAKLVDNEVRVVDGLSFSEPKTKAFESFLSALKADDKTTLVALPMDAAKSENAIKSGRNVDDVTLVRVDQLNCFNLLNHRYLVIGKAELEAWLSGAGSQTGKEAKVAPKGRGKSGEQKAARPAPARGAKKKQETK